MLVRSDRFGPKDAVSIAALETDVVPRPSDDILALRLQLAVHLGEKLSPPLHEDSIVIISPHHTIDLHHVVDAPLALRPPLRRLGTRVDPSIVWLRLANLPKVRCPPLAAPASFAPTKQTKTKPSGVPFLLRIARERGMRGGGNIQHAARTQQQQPEIFQKRRRGF